ncbi:hypothetical protein [Nucisporomicrobium flavum]|uniref:hypothetical protein n=1 Tax=Nucisporomicrobium flavum TaxID=2785915 RepID=UPI0018F700DC|nr:hypothetical protein [Nucisporomicrobium flavum]
MLPLWLAQFGEDISRAGNEQLLNVHLLGDSAAHRDEGDAHSEIAVKRQQVRAGRGVGVDGGLLAESRHIGNLG